MVAPERRGVVWRLLRMWFGFTAPVSRRTYLLTGLALWYWTPYADGLIHAIHMRVLRHIKALSESAPLSLR